MAIGQPQKKTTGELTDLGNPGYELDGNTYLKAALFPISIDGSILKDTTPEGIFLLNPSSWEESKSANWVQQQVPGQSDPIYQWVSSGPRTLMFEALVTADTSDYNVAESKVNTKKAKPKNVVEAVASFAIKLFKVQVPPPRSTQPAKNIEVLDISDHLNYYRSLMYPEYTNGTNGPGRLKASPPLLVLMAGSGIARMQYGTKITTKHDVWVMTDLKIRITKQLPNLAPLEAVVTFSLSQYNIRSFDSKRFYPKG